jgi:TRAP-type C4-dicarboxylate transport system substrate-binding protein
MRPRLTTLVLTTAVAGLIAACGSGRSDKAGGLTEPATLRIAVHKTGDSTAYFAKLFTDEVRRLSKGRMHIEFIPGNADNDPADADVRHARQVRDGRYDLGVIDAPAWDELGVRSLEPLQAPLLITDQSLFRAVLASPLAAKMLARLRAQHVVGLSLMMTYLQHPVGDDGPLTAPADFRGKRILAPVSRVNDAVLSALGATPLHLGSAQQGQAFAHHEIDGQEMGSFARPNVWLTPNVTFFADALTVVANEQRFAKLSDKQQRILRGAAAHAAQRAAGVMASDPEVGLVEGHCHRGHVVFATPAELAAVEQAMRPVYGQLERDPQVKATIAGIRDLKRRTLPDRAPKISASCSRTVRVTDARERDPSFLDGTYRWRVTRAGALKLGAGSHDPVIGMIAGMTLRGGGWAFADSTDTAGSGTFKVIGNRIAFTWPAKGYTNTFTFKRRADGTLELTPVLPMDTGDQVVWSSSPWTRIGPAVRKPP